MEKRVYQVLDEKGKYRSMVKINGEIVDFISRESKDAIVYTYDDIKKVINYYLEEKKIPIVIEAKTISNGKLCY